MAAASAILPVPLLPPGPVPLDLVIANERLVSRPARRPDRRAERKALRALAEVLSLDRAAILRCMATLALGMCEAGTAGVSLLDELPEGEIFRWKVLAGKLVAHEGEATPRNWSLCGSCLDADKPILYAYPARRFTYFAEIDVPIVEGLVIPFYTDGRAIGTIWIVSHDEARGFDAEDLRIMTSLAKFAGGALSPVFHAITEATAERREDSDQDSVWRGYLRRIARNDHVALAALFREARPAVFRIAIRILGLAADADEVAGDVFTRLWSCGYLYDDQRGSATGC
jgi:GAF domain-containing protein